MDREKQEKVGRRQPGVKQEQSGPAGKAVPAAASERTVDLLGYYPEWIREIKEFQGIASAEEPELSALYEKVDALWKDGFITDAGISGIKRWEGLLGRKPYPGDTLEERRKEVLGQWNRQLPYTLESLKDTLTAAVGVQHYELLLRPAQYEMDLYLLDQTLRTMQGIREMVKDTVPANLLVLVSGKDGGKAELKLCTASSMALRSQYGVRRGPWQMPLDGNWLLDGGYLLGWNQEEAWQEELYPVRICLSNESFVRKYGTEPAQSGFSVKASAYGEVYGNSAFRTVSAAAAETMCGMDLEFQSGAAAAANLTAGLTIERNLWLLDGGNDLNGSKSLNAEIRTETL